MKKLTKVFVFFLAIAELFLGQSNFTYFLTKTLSDLYPQHGNLSNENHDTLLSNDSLLNNNLMELNSNDYKSLDNLTDLENFDASAIDHIFYGKINLKGKAVGFHYEGISTKAQILNNIINIDSNGVYIAKIRIDGIDKISNYGMTSFFPKNWTPQEVIDSINQAYSNKVHIRDNKYIGYCNRGIKIEMYLNSHKNIITAYPKVINFNPSPTINLSI